MINSRKQIIGLNVLLLGFLIKLCVFASPAISDEITLAADEWYPYNGQENSLEEGYGVDIVRTIFESAGHTVVYKVMPWHRAVIKTRQGHYNAVIGALKEETPDFIFPDEEFAVSTEAFFAKKNCSWKFTDLASLQAVNIGLIEDYSYGEQLDQFFNKNRNIVEYVKGDNALKLNIKKLLHERIDVIVEDPNVLWQKAKKMGVAEQIINVGHIKKADKLYIAFSPNIEKSSEYARILSIGIRRLKASGELKIILDKYGLDYWK